MKVGTAKNQGCAFALFGSVFVAVGLFMGGWLVSDVVTWSRVQGWVEEPAEVLTCELKVNTGSDSTTYQALGTYRYERDGQGYTGCRIGLNNTADNLGHWHQERYEELNAARVSGQPIRIKVNPRNPSQAIYRPELRLSMVMMKLVFLLGFGGAGGAVVATGWWTKRSARRVSAQEKAFPDEPWKWNADWSSGVIRSAGRGLVVGLWIFSAMWNAISWTVLVAVWDQIRGEGGAALLLLLFPAVGFLVLLGAVYQTLRYKRYGRTVFRMASLPGVLGGSLGGAVVVPAGLQAPGGYHLTLSCVHRYITGSGKNRHTTEKVLWQDERTMKKDLMGGNKGRTVIPVLFALPFDGQPSSPVTSNDCILWRLQVTAQVPGVDLNSSFEVPVFKTAESRPDFVLDDSAIRDYSEATDDQTLLEEAGLRVRDAGQGLLEIDIPPRRHVKMALSLALFAIVWTAICIVLWMVPDVPMFLAVVFSLFDLPLLWFTLELFFGSQSIVIRHGEARFRSGLFGGGRLRTAPAGAVTNLHSTRGMQSGNKQYFSIRADLPDKKNLTLVSLLPSQRSIDAVLRVLQRALNNEKPFA